MELRNKFSVFVICLTIGLCGLGIFLSGTLSEKRSETQIEVSNTTETTTSSTNTTTTTKTTKKAVKTTKKKKKKKYTFIKVATATYSEYQQYAQHYGNYNEEQMNCLINLWNRESNWSPNSYNKKTSACGIPQAVPCSKIKASEGSNDWKAQIRWGVKYIRCRKDYGTPCKAWKHFKKYGWY